MRIKSIRFHLLFIGLVFCIPLMFPACSGEHSPISPESDRTGGLDTQDMGIIPDSQSRDLHYVPGEVNVVFNDDFDQTTALEFFALHQLNIKNSYNLRWATLYNLEITDGTPEPEMAERLRSDSAVRFAEPNYVRYFQEAPYIPNDPLWEGSDPGDDPRDNVFDQWGPAKLGVDIVWNDTKGSGDIVVAIIDSGVLLNHEDLEANIWINEDEIPDNGIDDDENGWIDDWRGWDCWDDDNEPWDYGSHGTGCAGIVAAVQNNELGLTGIAPNVKLMVIKVKFADDYSSDATIMYAMEYAVANGADICSMSFGGTDVDPMFEQSMIDAWDNGNGPLLIAAAGNNNSTEDFYPALYDSTFCVSATIPFRVNNIPCDEDRIHKNWEGWWWGSNYGPHVNISGFGERYMTTHSAGTDKYRDGIEYGFFNGTSCATPVVAGVTALVMSWHPGHEQQWYWDRMEATADDLNAPGFDIHTGWGRVNALRAVHGPDRFSDMEDINGFVPVDPAGDTLYDSIHDVADDRPFRDPWDLYKITSDSGECLSIDLDIFSWGEDLDMALYPNPWFSQMIDDSTIENHADSSFENIIAKVYDGQTYFVSVYSPEIGNSTTYGIDFNYVDNDVVITGTDLTPNNASPGETDVPFLQINADITCSCWFDGLGISKHCAIPSGGSANPGTLKLYQDTNGNYSFDSEDALIAVEIPGDTNMVRFPELGLNWTNDEPLVLFAVMDLSPDLDPGTTVSVSIEDYRDLTLLDGVNPDYRDFPISSDVVTIN